MPLHNLRSSFLNCVLVHVSGVRKSPEKKRSNRCALGQYLLLSVSKIKQFSGLIIYCSTTMAHTESIIDGAIVKLTLEKCL